MSRRGSPWSRLEVEATVESYFRMLEAGLRGEAVNKTAHRRALLPLLDDRTGGAVEAEIERPPDPPTVDDLLAALVARPKPRPGLSGIRRGGVTRARGPVDYLRIEARNRALGLAGEEFVVRFEQARLIAARRERLAAKVSHVSVERGDGTGYDVLSFGEDSRERLIEVKTTKFGEYTPFYVTRNEVEVSRSSAEAFQLYRLYDFGERARMFVVPGALEQGFGLEPTDFVARVN